MIRLIGLGKIAWLVAILAALLSVLALPVLAAVTYSAPYSVRESGGISYGMVATSALAPNTWMAANGFMRSDALDTRVETADSSTEYSHMVASDRTLAAVPLTANGQQNVYYTTGNTTATSMDVVLGYAGYATIPDEATLEVGNDFSIEHDGWVDVDAVGATLLFKRDAFITYVSAAGQVSSSILGVATATNPTGNSDPGAIWTLEAQAYNDNAADGAGINVNVASAAWSDYIVFTIASTWVESVDFTANTAATFTTAEVSVQYGGNWSVVYNNAFVNLAVTTINLYPNYVRPLTGMRVRFFNTTGAPAQELDLLREVNFNALNQTLTVDAAALTSSEMLIDTVADTTDLKIFVDGVEADTAALGGASIPNNGYDWLLGGVATPYHNVFTIRSEGYYTFPTGNSDPGGTWANEIQAYDNDINLFASTSVAVVGWSNYLILTHAAFVTDGLRYQAFGGLVAGDYTSAEIDVTSDGVTWTNVATFDPPDVGAPSWAEATFDRRIVTDVRIRGYRAVAGGGGAATFGAIEIQWYGIVQDWYQPNAIVTSSTLIDRASATANNATITWGHNPVGILYDGTGTVTAHQGVAASAPITLVVGVNTITAGASSGTFLAAMDGDNTSVAANGTTTISGSPQSMTLGGNTIRKIGGVAGTFTITTGGVGVTLGSMTASTQPAVGGSTTELPQEVAPEVPVSDWYVEPDVSGSLLTNPFRDFVLLVSDNTTLTELQTWRWYGLIFVIGVTVLAAKNVRGHQMLTGIAAGAAIVVLVVMTIWPLWALVFTAGSVLGGMVAERMGNA